VSKRWILSATAAVAAVLLSGVAAAEDPIIIGAAVARTGWMVQYDDGPFKGVEMGIEDINAQGGVLGRQLKLVVSDTKTDPAGSARAAQEVLDQGAQLVIASCDLDFGGPAAFTANNAGVVAFGTCAADPKFGVQGIGRFAFTMATGTPAIAANEAEWAFNKKGWKTTYILMDTIAEYTKSVCGYFKERWVELAGAESVVGEDSFLGTDGTFPAAISRIKALPTQPDFIRLCSGGPGVGIVKQLRDAGITQPLLASDSMDGDNWLQATPDLSEFYYGAYGSLFGDDPNPVVKGFMERFIAKYGDKPISSQAITGYAVIQAFKVAAERAGSTNGEALVAEYEKFKDEELIVGKTSYSPDLHINLGRGQLIMQVQNGKHAAIEWHVPAKVPAPKL